MQEILCIRTVALGAPIGLKQSLAVEKLDVVASDSATSPLNKDDLTHGKYWAMEVRIKDWLHSYCCGPGISGFYCHWRRVSDYRT